MISYKLYNSMLVDILLEGHWSVNKLGCKCASDAVTTTHSKELFFLYIFYDVIHIRIFSYLYFVDFLEFLCEKCHKGTPSRSPCTGRSFFWMSKKKMRNWVSNTNYGIKSLLYVFEINFLGNNFISSISHLLFAIFG